MSHIYRLIARLIFKFARREKPHQEDGQEEFPPEGNGISSKWIWTMMQDHMEENRKETEISKIRYGLRGWKLIAAVMLLLAGVSVLYSRRPPEMVSKELFGHYHTLVTMRNGAPPVLDGIRHSAPHYLILPDGSRVCLNYGSSLSYDASFGKRTREVFLSGEALFETVPDGGRPFIVHCRGFTVRVLGTCFNVMGYEDEPASEITLIRGAVQVIHGSESRLLHPQEQAIVKDDKATVRRLRHPEESIGWSMPHPYFEFNNASLKKVIRQLARWYQMKIVYSENVSSMLVTGRISQDIPLGDILSQLQDIGNGNFRFVIRKDTIFMTNVKIRK